MTSSTPTVQNPPAYMPPTLPAPSAPTGPTPRLLHPSVLSPKETLLRETRATQLHYLPGPILACLLFSILGYSAVAAAHTAWPAFPYLTSGIVGLGTVAAHYLEYFFGLMLLFSVLWLLIRYARWTMTVYAVTSGRVIVQRGIISRDFDEIPIAQVRAVEIHQPIFQRLFGYGTVRVTSEGGNRIANEAWVGVPDPFEIQRLINTAAATTPGR
ncbi:MAG: PH domain-containing protein [Thermoplasmata archaeon]|nr:PH domain-containing protein [Thermoplasmata archaeon]